MHHECQRNQESGGQRERKARQQLRVRRRVKYLRRTRIGRDAESDRDDQVQQTEQIEDDGAPPAAGRVEPGRYREGGRADQDIADAGGEQSP